MNAYGNPCITTCIGMSNSIAERIRMLAGFSAALYVDCHHQTFVTTATLPYQDCLFGSLHCNCQSREPRDGAQKRGVICQSQSCFFTTQKHANRRYDANLVQHSRESHNKSHKNRHYLLFSLSPAARHHPSYTRFSTAPCPPVR